MGASAPGPGDRPRDCQIVFPTLKTQYRYRFEWNGDNFTGRYTGIDNPSVFRGRIYVEAGETILEYTQTDPRNPSYRGIYKLKQIGPGKFRGTESDSSGAYPVELTTTGDSGGGGQTGGSAGTGTAGGVTGDVRPGSGPKPASWRIVFTTLRTQYRYSFEWSGDSFTGRYVGVDNPSVFKGRIYTEGREIVLEYTQTDPRHPNYRGVYKLKQVASGRFTGTETDSSGAYPVELTAEPPR